MSLNFLARVASGNLPYQTDDPLEMLHIEVLLEAKVIEADCSWGDWDTKRGARVTSITPRGQELLDKIHRIRALRNAGP